MPPGGGKRFALCFVETGNWPADQRGSGHDRVHVAGGARLLPVNNVPGNYS